jgi:hypothetical protein
MIAAIYARVTVLAALALALAGCSSAPPRPVFQRPGRSQYKGWTISVTPTHLEDLWREQVRVWPPEVHPETHPGIAVSFSGASSDRRAVEQAATAVARRYIDASVPVNY